MHRTILRRAKPRFGSNVQVRFAPILCMALASCAPQDNTEPKFEISCDSRAFAGCDVRETACATQLADFVACLREKPSQELPRIEVVTTEELAQEAEDFWTGEEGQNSNRFATAVELFAETPSTLPTLEERIADWTDVNVHVRGPDHVQLVDHGEGFTSSTYAWSLARALTYSMHRHEYDVEGLLDELGNDVMAQRALLAAFGGVEAMYADQVWFAYEEESHVDPWPSIRSLGDLETRLIFGATSLAPYILHGVPPEYSIVAASQTWARDATAGIDALLDTPALTIDAFPGDLLSTRYWRPEAGDHSVIELQEDLLGTFENYENIRDTVLGSWASSMFLLRMFDEPPFSTSSWHADRFLAWYDEDTGSTAALWLWTPTSDVVFQTWYTLISERIQSEELSWILATRSTLPLDTMAVFATDNPSDLAAWAERVQDIVDSASLAAR